MIQKHSWASRSNKSRIPSHAFFFLLLFSATLHPSQCYDVFLTSECALLNSTYPPICLDHVMSYKFCRNFCGHCEGSADDLTWPFRGPLLGLGFLRPWTLPCGLYLCHSISDDVYLLPVFATVNIFFNDINISFFRLTFNSFVCVWTTVVPWLLPPCSCPQTQHLVFDEKRSNIVTPGVWHKGSQNIFSCR